MNEPKPLHQKLTDIALGRAYHEHALLAVKDSAVLNDEERAVVQRYLDGAPTSLGDQCSLQEIARRVSEQPDVSNQPPLIG